MPAYIHAIGTAVPAYQISQSQSLAFMQRALHLSDLDFRKIRALYRLGRIQKRYSVLEDYVTEADFEFYPNKQDQDFPSTSQRMAVYEKEALPLALKAVAALQMPVSDVTHLITFSCTGMYAPGLDIDILENLGLSSHTHRICINFMGCYAAFNALKTATAFCEMGAKVLLVGVELCTLHLQKSLLEDHLVSAALFADGAAAVLLSGQKQSNSLEIKDFYCELIGQGKKDMAWRIADSGFDMRLSSYIPTLLENNMDVFVKNFSEKTHFSHIDHWAIHAGGRKILEASQKALGLSLEDLAFSHQVLENYGNMSSVTVLFVLQKLWENGLESGQKIVGMAFGPGLTVESALLESV